MMKTFFSILVTFFATTTFAQKIDGEIELAGFLIGQPRSSVHAQLGPPIQRNPSEDGWIYEFHKLKPDTSVYALFKYARWDTTHIYAIQISGNHYDEMHPFRGLKLGATKTEVDHILGKPDKIETIEDPPLTLQYYPHKNYSVDISKQGKLYGIQVFGNILDNKIENQPSTKGFRNAVVSKNVDSLLVYLAPNIELHKSGQIVRFSGAAREEFKKNGEFVKLLLGETRSVWFVFAKERAEGMSELKVTETGNQKISVDKFFDSSIISEIILKPHAGRWKVSQIKFR